MTTPLLPAMKAAVFSATKEEADLTHDQQEILGRIYTNYITESRDKIAALISDSSFGGQFIESRILSLLEQTRPYTKILAEEG